MIDFVVMPGDPGQPRKVTTAIASPESLAAIHELCDELNITLGCVVPRPVAAASLFNRLAGASSGNSLLISLLTREVDFSVISRGHVIFSRTIRLVDEPDELLLLEQLISEVNRTLIAAPHGVNDDENIEHVYMFGSLSEQRALLKGMAEQLEIPVSLIDPFDRIDVTDQELRRGAYRHAGLLGMIRDHLDQKHPIDLLNPKLPPEPPNYLRKVAWYGTAAALVLALVGYLLHGQVREARQDNQAMTRNLRQLQKILTKSRKRAAMVDAVQQRHSASINLLDELRDLSLRFPEPQDIIIRRMSVSLGKQGGVAEMQVDVRRPEILARLEQDLRDQYHQVKARGALQRNATGPYPWQSRVTVAIRPRTPAEYQTTLPPQLASADAAEQATDHTNDSTARLSHATAQPKER